MKRLSPGLARTAVGAYSTPTPVPTGTPSSTLTPTPGETSSAEPLP